MKKMSALAGLVLLGTAGAVSAQPAQGGGAMTRADVVARADQAFARADADRDGRVTRDEMRQAMEQRRAARTERRGAAAEQRGDRAERRFQRLDQNRDGSVSLDEVRQAQATRGQRHATRQQRRQNNLLVQQGFLTQAQWRERALQRFDRLDFNRDGTVTREERRQARQARRQG